MSVLCLNVCRLCVPNIMSLGVCFIKKIALVKAGAFAWYSVKIRVIFGLRFERQKVDNKANLHENWNKTCKVYSGIFWIFFQISSKSIFIILSYTVSKLARFLRLSVV